MQDPPRVCKVNKKDRRYASTKSPNKLKHKHAVNRLESNLDINSEQLDFNQCSISITTIVHIEIIFVLRGLDYSRPATQL